VLDDRGSITGRGRQFFSSPPREDRLSGAHSASYRMGTGNSFLGGKAARREADHSPPSDAEVKNAWSFSSSPQYVFTAWRLIKQWVRLHGVVLI